MQVNTDGQQQIDQYKASFDSLRTSIYGIGKPLDDLSGNIRSLDKDLSNCATSGNKLKETFKDLTETFSTWKSILTTSLSDILSWTNILSAGLTVLTRYGPAILNWINNLIASNSTLTALNKALKDNKIIMDAVNKSRIDGQANAQQDLVQLKLLYTATQDHNLAIKERKKATDQLREQFPDIFENITSETILAGKAKKQYDELTKAIIANARAKTSGERVIVNQQRQLGNEQKLIDLKIKLLKIEKELTDVTASRNHFITMPAVFGGNTLLAGTEARDTAGQAKIESLTGQRDELKKIISDIQEDSKLLEGQNNALTKSIITDTEMFGVNVLGIIKTTQSKRMKATGSAHKQTEQLHKDYVFRQLQATTQGYVNEALAASQYYNNEKAKLDQSLKDKLTSLDQYYKDVQTLENKYHDSIGNVLNKQQRGAALPDAKGTTKLDDSLKINQLDLTNVTTHEQQITKIKTDAEKQREKAALDSAQKVAVGAFSIITKSIQAQSDAKVQSLEKDKSLALSNTNLTSAQRLAIQAKYQKQEASIKAKAFKEQQEASIAQAIINGAIAITKTESDLGPIAGTIAIAGVIANTAVQVATIAKQKPPAYAKGGLHYQSDGKGGMLSGYSRTDNTNAYLRSGEGIVVSEAMQVPWARNLVSAINVGFGGRDFSAPVSTRGFAVGGIFTDGGNANRYYNQPVNDQKNLANTVAYQMINNFPPVYVDVKDVNNQQNILAQTVNRVNL